jgi:arginyl-tRNA synthetase
MKNIIDILEDRISSTIAKVTGLQDCAAIVKPATDAKFGDYQVNGVMPLAKELKTDPRKLAEDVVKNLDIGDICEPPEVAGPGFINLRLKPDFVAANLLQINKDADRLGIEETEKPQTVVVDFSGPNIAKQMHVGHLRSTIIGDCICRVLEFEGHTVIRQNHIGDWGTPMGMVIYGLASAGVKELDWATDSQLRPWQDILVEINEGGIKLSDLEKNYKDIVEIEKNYPSVAANIRKVTNLLQGHDPELKAIWKAACEITLRECSFIYNILGVSLSNEDVRGESAYHDDLPKVVGELKRQKLAKKSDGAICVFPEGFKNKEGEPLPFIIQKSDGAYLYATTDLAALRYRVDKLKADKIIYVTDARQSLHFQMLFAVARMAKWVSDDIELSHVMFGSVLGENGKPLKTREGENVKLKDLLDEAVKRAKLIVEEKNPDLPPDKKEQIAKAVGIGAVKYADYSNSRTSDYIFSYDKMLAMDGNTAPYMQYAYARIKSIERKAQTKKVPIETELAGVKTLSLSETSELDLAKHLIRYGEAIEAAAADYRPNYLTAYLYELAQKFSVFYTNCPVLQAEPDKRPTRLLLCDLTAKTIKHGLSELLGIEVVEQM